MRQWLSDIFGGSDATENERASSEPERSTGAEPDAGGRPSAPENDGETPEMSVARSPEKDRGPISGVEYTIRTKEEPSPSRPFAHGFIDGVEGIDPAAFERFLVQSGEQGRLQGELGALSEREDELQNAKEERLSLEAELQRKKQRLADLKAEEADRRERFERLEEQLQLDEQLQKERSVSLEETAGSLEKSGSLEKAAAEDRSAEVVSEEIVSEEKEANGKQGADGEQGAGGKQGAEEAPERGSLIYAMLYSGAGLLFVAGDVIMSREVVSRALRLGGDAEPWIFAFGLAMLAVLMKPAYDRLVEKPYWKGRETAFRWTIIAGVLAAAGTLGVLGAFRADAFETRQRVSRIQKKLEEGVAAETLSKEAQADLREKRASLQQSISGSPLSFWSFVLSGVLFAAAGAVCLGIGLRHSRDWYHRSGRPLARKGGGALQAWWRRRRLRSRREEAEGAYRSCRDRRAQLEAGLQAMEKQLAAKRPLGDLREELRAIRREKRQLRAQLWTGAGNKSVDAYRNGYETGDTVVVREETDRPEAAQRDSGDERANGAAFTEATGPEAASDERAAAEAPGNEASSDQDSGDEETKNEADESRRPFLAVREAISRGKID